MQKDYSESGHTRLDSLTNAWVRLENALKQSIPTQTSFGTQNTSINYQNLLMMNQPHRRPLSTHHTSGRPQTSITYNSNEMTINHNDGGMGSQFPLPRPTHPKSAGPLGPLAHSSVTSIKSLMNLRAQSRPHSRPATGNPFNQKNDQEILASLPQEEREQIFQISQVIHSLPVDVILDLYTVQCHDCQVEYNPGQAVKFIQKIKKSCRKRQFTLVNCGLGVQCSYVIADIIQRNEHFCRYDVSRNLLSDTGAALIGQAVKHNSTIVHLDLSSNDIGPQGCAQLFSALIDNDTLISLNIGSKQGLNRNRLGAKGVQQLEMYLKYSSSLQFLDLNNTGLNLDYADHIVQGVKESKSLISLNFANNELGPHIGDIMAQELINTELVQLNLSSVKLGDSGLAGFYFLGTMKAKQYKLESLDFSNNNLTGLGVSKFLDVLSKNMTIQQLIFDNNNLSGQNMSTVHQMLWENATLSYLSFNGCGIASDGGVSIGLGLTRNNALQELYLRDNQLKNEGTQLLAQSLKDHRCLRIIDISLCGIGDDVGVILADSIKHNQNLTTVNLKENNLHDTTGLVMCDSIRTNKNLIKLNLERNVILYKYTQEIEKLLNENINMMKASEMPMFYEQAEGLKGVDKLKQETVRQAVQLKTKEEMVIKEIQVTEKRLIMTRDDEQKQTFEVQEQKQLAYSQCAQWEEERSRNDDDKTDIIKKMDFEVGVFNQKIGLCNNESHQAMIDLQEKRDQLQKLKQTAPDKIQMKDQQFKVIQNKANTSEEGFKSLEKNILNLQNQIEAMKQAQEPPPNLNQQEEKKEGGSQKESKKTQQKEAQNIEQKQTETDEKQVDAPEVQDSKEINPSKTIDTTSSKQDSQDVRKVVKQ